MASISSLSGSSSSSSIYGNRTTNILSGLASGLDTEGMIEGLISSYQQKISGLQQDITKLQWQQEGYQSISDKLVEFARKYTSYTSSTNLFSSSFFNKAVNIISNGTYSNLVSASGKTNSTIEITSASLASSARYTHTNELGGISGSVVTGDIAGFQKDVITNDLTGSITLTYGTKNITIDFDESDFMGVNKDGTGQLDLNKMADVINKKLEDISISDSSGKSMKASECINIEVIGGAALKFTDKKSGNSISLNSATGNMSKAIADLGDTISDKTNTIQFVKDTTAATSTEGYKYLEGKTVSVTLNGQTKKITLDAVTPTDGQSYTEAFSEQLQEKLNEAFGEGKVTVGTIESELSSKDGKLTFTTTEGNTFSIKSDNENVNKTLGLGESGLASYLDTSRTLGDLLNNEDTAAGTIEGLSAIKGEGLFDSNGELIKGNLVEKTVEDEDGNKVTKYYDTAGHQVDEKGYRITEDEDGNPNYLYSVEINGVEIGQYTKDTSLETIVNNINSNTDAGVNVSYSNLTNEFIFTCKQSGAGGDIAIGDGLASKLFGTVNKDETTGNFDKGVDAKIGVIVNGEPMTLERSSNTFEIDGMSITIDGAFQVDASKGEKNITFNNKTDTDTIVDAIKSMVEDYNAIINDVRSAYTTQPLKTTSGGRYEPLTDDDEEGMTESEIEKYEEKAKTGILYMDQDLSSLYSALRSAITPGGSDTSFLKSIGIETAYEDGVTTLKLDETALRNALEENPDQVRDAFTKTKENGAQSDGLMASITKVTEKYAATTGSVKGILIEKAGSKYSPTAALDNTILNKMQEIEEEISTWQDKMSNKVDYYSNKFTQLELLINQMNSQSSSLASLTGGY